VVHCDRLLILNNNIYCSFDVEHTARMSIVVFNIYFSLLNLFVFNRLLHDILLPVLILLFYNFIKSYLFFEIH